MPRLTAMDEYFVHQIPEPLPNVATLHEHWRESLFFVLHPRDGLGDVVILTLAHFPARQEMDSLQLGPGRRRADDRPTTSAPYDGDPHTMAVGPVRIDIAEPFRTVHLHVDDGAEAPVALDLTFTRPHPRVRAAAGHDAGRSRADLGPEPHGAVGHVQRHVHPRRARRTRSTTGGASATTRGASATTPAARCGCGWPCSSPTAWPRCGTGSTPTAPASTPTAASRRPTAPIRSPVVDVRHDLRVDRRRRRQVSYGRDGADVAGIAGRVELVLEGGRDARARGRGPLGTALRRPRRRAQRGDRHDRRRPARARPSTS